MTVHTIPSKTPFGAYPSPALLKAGPVSQVAPLKFSANSANYQQSVSNNVAGPWTKGPWVNWQYQNYLPQLASAYEGATIPDDDTKDFWEIVRGKKGKKDILKDVIKGHIRVGPDGSISVPMPRIDKYDFNTKPNPPYSTGDEGDGDGDGNGQPQPGPGQPGVGSGPGGVGDVIGQDGDGDGEGGDKAGEGEGGYDQEIWDQRPASDIAKMIGEEFELPFLEDRGKGQMEELFETADSQKRTPPGSLLVKETAGNIVARQMALHLLEEEENGELVVKDDLDPLNLINDKTIVNRNKDYRFIDWRIRKRKHSQAVIFYVMDVSGSINNEMKQMARTNNLLLSLWIKYQYGLMAAKRNNTTYNDKDHFGKGVAERFIIFTDGAKEVEEDEFYSTRQSGGTRISSGIEKVKEIVQEDYDPDQWNIYVFLYSDGDSFSDNEQSGAMIDEMLNDGKGMNLFGYVHLDPYRGAYSWGENFNNYIKKRFADEPRVRNSVLVADSLDEYKKVLKTLLSPEKSGGKR